MYRRPVYIAAGFTILAGVDLFRGRSFNLKHWHFEKNAQLEASHLGKTNLFGGRWAQGQLSEITSSEGAL